MIENPYASMNKQTLSYLLKEKNQRIIELEADYARWKADWDELMSAKEAEVDRLKHAITAQGDQWLDSEYRAASAEKKVAWLLDRLTYEEDGRRFSYGGDGGDDEDITDELEATLQEPEHESD